MAGVVVAVAVLAERGDGAVAARTPSGLHFGGAAGAGAAVVATLRRVPAVAERSPITAVAVSTIFEACHGQSAAPSGLMNSRATGPCRWDQQPVRLL